MNAFFMLYRIWFQIAAIVVLVGGATLGIHKFLDYEQQIGYDRRENEQIVLDLAAEKAAREKEIMWNKRLEDANANYAKMDSKIRVASAASGNAANSVRDALETIRNGVPSATAASLAQSVVALSTVFGNCVTEYRGMAETADKWSNDAQRLLESWPKVKP